MITRKTIDTVRDCGLLIDWGIYKFSAKHFSIVIDIILENFGIRLLNSYGKKDMEFWESTKDVIMQFSIYR